ncbi:MAG: hypothetical protein V1816_09895 [Pseudomonadota bacterium]
MTIGEFTLEYGDFPDWIFTRPAGEVNYIMTFFAGKSPAGVAARAGIATCRRKAPGKTGKLFFPVPSRRDRRYFAAQE